MRKALLVLITILGFTYSAQAQTGPCPGGSTLAVFQTGDTINVCVAPSLDSTAGHNATNPVSGTPVVTRYDLFILNDGDPLNAPPQTTINIGKPALNASNTFWVTLTTAQVPTGRKLRATAAAVGPDGVSGRAPLSNPFGVATVIIPAAPLTISVAVP